MLALKKKKKKKATGNEGWRMSSSPTWRTWPMPGMFVWNQEPIVSRFECPRFIVLSNVCNPRGVSAAAAGSIRRDSISSLSHQRHLLIKMEGGGGKPLRFFYNLRKFTGFPTGLHHMVIAWATSWTSLEFSDPAGNEEGDHLLKIKENFVSAGCSRF